MRDEPRRIQLHDHADGNSGGKLAAAATTTTAASGGTSSSGGSGGFDGIAEHLATSETDTGKRLAPDGAGGVDWAAATVIPAGTYELANEGGQDLIKAHGTMGATETIDLADGNYHTATLDANCTISFATITAGVLCRWWVELLEDGTGGHTPTWPAAVVWVNGVTPTHDTTIGSRTVYEFWSIDGGTTIFGAAGASAITVKDEGTPLATPAASLDFVGAGVTASGTGGAKTITIPGGASALSGLSDVSLSGLAAAQFLRYSGSAWLNAALIVSDYPFHSEVLCDSAGPILQSNGDVITVVGVPN